MVGYEQCRSSPYLAHGRGADRIACGFRSPSSRFNVSRRLSAVQSFNRDRGSSKAPNLGVIKLISWRTGGSMILIFRTGVIATLIWLGMVLSASPAQAQQRSAAELHASGVASYSRGLYSTAAVDFYDVYKQYPSDSLAPDALYQLARTLIQLKKAKDACLTLGELRNAYRRNEAALLLERQLACGSGNPNIPASLLRPSSLSAAPYVATPAVPRATSKSARPANRPLGPSQTAIDLGMTDLELTQALCDGRILLPVPARNAAQHQARLKADACREIAAYKATLAAKHNPDWAAKIGAAYAQAYLRAPANTFSRSFGATTASGNTAMQNIIGVVRKTFTYNVRNAVCKPTGRLANCSFDISTNQRVFLGQSQMFTYSSPWRKQTLSFEEAAGALRSPLLDRQMAAIVADQARNASSSSPSNSGPTKGDRCRADAMTMMDWGASGSAAAKSMFCGL